jgi:hypothetical protein
MKTKIGFILGLYALSSLMLAEAAGGLALVAKVGTLGLGLEGSTSLLEDFNARLGYNAISFETDQTIDDIKYDVDIDLQSLSLLLDWHPLSGGFRVSAGVMANGNDAKGSAPVGNYTIGDTPFTNVGLDARVDFNSAAPYLGIGWGNAVASDKGWGFNVDLGVMFQGTPEVSLIPTGPNAGLVPESELIKEQQKLQDDADDFKYYPVLSVGVSYRFL